VTLERLEIQSLRNLSNVSISLCAGINIFHGANGSGKTSLLEAVHVLGLGRSFRTLRHKRLVMEGLDACTVFGVTDSNHQIGIQKRASGESMVRINGATAPGLSQLAHHLPIQLFDPTSLDVLSGPSQPRRQLLDWGVFHVEPDFFSFWTRSQRALQQRNSQLKAAKISPMELQVWEQELVEAALPLHASRLNFFRLWQPYLSRVMSELLPGIVLSVDYSPGWDVDASLAELLRESRGRDMERGFTQLGPHRADIRIKANGVSADDWLSRGQMKLAVCALKLSLAEMLLSYGVKPVLLMDDLPSELDSGARHSVCVYIARLGVQALMTCIDADQLSLGWGEMSVKVFHVEQGIISPIAD